jgi:uncharacterized protein (TIGR03000 family)
MGSVVLMVTAATPSQTEARWWSRPGWGGGPYGYGPFGWWRPGWGAYYPYAPFYPGLYGYPYYGYPLYGYYPPVGSTSLSTVASTAGVSNNDNGETQLPQPAGDVLVPPADAGVIRLHVPDQFADVTFNGHPVSSIGTARTYVTPNLEPGKSLSYTIKVSWLRGDQRMSHEAVVEARPGQINTVDFARAVSRATR